MRFVRRHAGLGQPGLRQRDTPTRAVLPSRRARGRKWDFADEVGVPTKAGTRDRFATMGRRASFEIPRRRPWRDALQYDPQNAGCGRPPPPGTKIPRVDSGTGPRDTRGQEIVGRGSASKTEVAGLLDTVRAHDGRPLGERTRPLSGIDGIDAIVADS